MPTVAEAYDLALQLYKAGRAGEADRVCAQILDAAPRHAESAHLRGLIAHAQGRAADAVALIEAAISFDGTNASYHNNLGEALRATGRAAEAVLAYSRAIAINDRFGEAYNNLGAVYKESGRLAEALGCYQKALDLNPNLAPAHMHLALVLMAQGQMEAAITRLEHAISLDPNLAAARMNLGIALQSRGRHAEAAQQLEQAVAARPGLLVARLHLGNSLMELGREDEAAAHYRHILTLKPDFPEARRNLGVAVERLVPSWHFPMANDTRRNDAFDQALRAVIGPDTVALGIGAGTGLLAMMAARAGAKRVIACDGSPPIARAAAAVIARNGFSDRVTVIAKNSTGLTIGADMPEPADVLVTDILSSDLLSEDVLNVTLDARSRLLKPNAAILPAEIALRGALVGGAAAAALSHVGTVSGFDLTPFNDFTPHRRFTQAGMMGWERLSADTELLRFNLAEAREFRSERQSLTLKVTRSGRCHGVLQWIWMRLTGNITYDNHPIDGPGLTGWQPILHSFPEPLTVTEGDVVRLVVWHNRFHPSIMLEPNPS